jgi:uncharacterized protein (UPF0335 family)
MTMQSNSQKQLRHICERLVRLEDDKTSIANEIKETKATAKSDGFDTALITKTVRLMRLDAEKRKKELDQLDLLDSYVHAVGLLDEKSEDEGGEE